MRGGIYEIISPSGRRYIGSAKNFEKRKREHFSALRRGKHHSTLLQRAFRKYGADLVFRVVIVCRDADLFFYEQLLIDQLRPAYNVNPSATGTRGLKWSAESRARIRGKRSREGSKISAGMKANFTPEELSERARWARSGWTDKSMAIRIAKATGREDSDETRAKKSAALIGRPVSEETRKKLAAQKGWKHSEDAKAKMRLARAART